MQRVNDNLIRWSGSTAPNIKAAQEIISLHTGRFSFNLRQLPLGDPQGLPFNFHTERWKIAFCVTKGHGNADCLHRCGSLLSFGILERQRPGRFFLITCPDFVPNDILYRDALIPPGRTVPQAGDSPGVSYSQPGAITFQGPFSHRRVLENAPQCHRFGKAGHCGFDP